MSNRPSVQSLAKRTADTRRVLMNTFGGDLGVGTSLDLMGIENPSSAHLAFAKVIAQTHQETLSKSSLFLADDDMVALLDAATTTMPDQHLALSDIMTPNGFVYFADPLPDRSGVPPEVPIHAMSWAYLTSESPLLTERGAGDSLLITSYVPVREVMEAKGMLGPGKELAPGAPKYLPNATVMWTIGTLIGKAFGDEPPPGGYTPGFYQRAMAAFWTLAQQPKMTTTSDEPTGAPVDRRRNKRAGVTNANEPVHVVRLYHRPTGEVTAQVPGQDAPGRKMAVRAAIRGHWRNQWYRSVQLHRHIWIAPHWRGPEDAPVVGGERVFLASGPKTDPGAEPSTS